MGLQSTQKGPNILELQEEGIIPNEPKEPLDLRGVHIYSLLQNTKMLPSAQYNCNHEPSRKKREAECLFPQQGKETINNPLYKMLYFNEPL